MGPSSIWEASVTREPEPLDTGRQQLDGHCLSVLPRLCSMRVAIKATQSKESNGGGQPVQ